MEVEVVNKATRGTNWLRHEQVNNPVRAQEVYIFAEIQTKVASHGALMRDALQNLDIIAPRLHDYSIT